ncbi:MAG: hypothetical protein ACO37V_08735, partial [Ilumatobacteraceae bacterium]
MSDAPDPVVLKKDRWFLPRWWRRGRPWRVLVVAMALIATMIAYYLFTLLQVWSTGRSDHDRPVDAVVVMGAAQYDGRPSPQLQARL